MTGKAVALQADLQDKQVSFTRLSEHAWACTAERAPTPASSRDAGAAV